MAMFRSNGNSSEGRLVEVFAGFFIDAEMVKAILQESGIEVFLKDENMGVIAPWYVSAGGNGAVKVAVSSNDCDKATSIIQKYEESRQ